MGIYFIFAAVIVIIIFAILVSYKEDHPKKSHKT